MGCDVQANLIGAVQESEISNFLATHFHCRASYLHVEPHVYGKKCELVNLQEDYDTNENWVTFCGPIIMEFLGNQHGFENGEKRSIFYIRNNVNFFENLEYYEEKGLGEMVRSQTTHVSAHSEAVNISIIKAIVEEFGGWFTENDCDDKYVRIYGRRETVHASVRERRVDIIANVQTITGDISSPISRICAIRTNAETGLLVEVFDKTSSECGSTCALLTAFCNWISEMVNEVTSIKDICIWSNGDMYADVVLRRACETTANEYPIPHGNSRDMHTLFDIVVTKKGYASEEACIADMEKNIDDDVLDNESDYAYKMANILHKAYLLALGRR